MTEIKETTETKNGYSMNNGTTSSTEEHKHDDSNGKFLDNNNKNESLKTNGNISDCLPKTIKVPVEHVKPLLQSDIQYYNTLKQKYKSYLDTTLKFETDLILRFTLGHRHVKAKKRLGETCKGIDLFIKIHNQYDFLNLAGLEEKPNETKAKQYWEQYIYGVDHQGHPNLYDKIGPMNTAKLIELAKSNMSSMRTQRYRLMCRLQNFKSYLCVKYNKLIYKHNIIFDLKGLSYNTHFKSDARNMSKAVIGELQQIYPEVAHKIFLINCPGAFKKIWSVAKRFVDKDTQQKIKIYTIEKYDLFVKEMSQMCDTNQLSPEYGGSDKSIKIQLGHIPEKYCIDVTKRYKYTLPTFPIHKNVKG